MQRARLLLRTGNISLLGEKSVLRRKVFTMDGHGKENGVPRITVGDSEQEEVMKLKYFNMDDGSQYTEKSVVVVR